jgi:hypothetical protein
MSKTATLSKEELMPVNRRDFLKIAGLATGAVATGISPFSTHDAEAGAISIATGFHWSSPVEGWRSDESKRLLQNSGRWGAVVLLYPSSQGQANGAFVDACNKIMDARQATGGGRSLDQSIVRLWYGGNVSLNGFVDADNWLRANGYYDSLNFFVQNGGRNVVVFNELNVPGEPQYAIDPRIMGYLGYALQNNYWNGGNRLLYTLFPGPSGLQPFNGSNWTNGFWEFFVRYDLLASAKTPKTFDQIYPGVDSHLNNRTMLYHNGRGVYDRLSLHCYTWDPTSFKDPNPQSAALQYMTWTRDSIDPSGWVYVTEASGASTTDYNGQYNAGAALADFQYNANSLFRDQSPYFLQAVYGYILESSDSSAVSQAAHKISDAFLTGYRDRRLQLGFG